MVPHLMSLCYPPHFFFFIYILLLVSAISYCENVDKHYTECKKSFDCGGFKNLSYPFWGGSRPEFCGHKGFELKSCEDGQHPTIASETLKFLVRDLDQSLRVMYLQLLNFQDYICPTADQSLANSTGSDVGVFGYDLKLKNLNLLYNCSSTVVVGVGEQNRISYCGYGGHGMSSSFYGGDEILINSGLNSSQCSLTIKVPVLAEAFNGQNYVEGGNSPDNLRQLLGEGFNVSYEYDKGPSICEGCMASNGICGTNTSDLEFICLCPQQPYSLVCPAPPGDVWNVGRKLRVALGASLGTVIIMLTIFIFWYRHKKRQYESFVSRSIKSAPSSKGHMEKRGSYNGVSLFTYEELEEATNNFHEARELGDGGFGTVYYGKLEDGREVAVKRLYENNYKRVEQFLNEVDILTRLRHQNLVLLYGCTSSHSRELLLVYDYIPNGTLADHLHGERAKLGALSWPIRMNIAVETASALAYLHASVIVHRDVKTNNILLDNNFCVKVADFGLSRLFPIDVTHVSTAPQGTPGYVDPEYHQCYQLTDKSDVYSFGVVLIELISSMPAVDISRHRHEINLSNLAINKIQTNALKELVDPGLGFESDCAARKMISAVAELAFQCLQSAKELRPSMENVLEILKHIQNGDYCSSTTKAEEEIDIRSDDVGLLKISCPISPPPDSVNHQLHVLCN